MLQITNRKSLVISNRGVQIARIISPKLLSKTLPIAVQIARFVIRSLCQTAAESQRRALQIASDLRFAIQIANRNRTKSRDLENLVCHGPFSLVCSDFTTRRLVWTDHKSEFLCERLPFGRGGTATGKGAVNYCCRGPCGP